MANFRDVKSSDLRRVSNYTQATIISADGSEWRDLQCPKCGCDKITVETPDLGADARCYECGHEFTVTENCFKLTKLMDNSDDL